MAAVGIVGCSLGPRPAANRPSTTPPRVAGGPPTVAIAAPGAGVFGWVGYPLDFDVRGADPYGIGVSRLDLRVNDELVDSVVTPGGAAQLTFASILEWIPWAEGNFAVSVQAFRPDGSASDAAGLTIGVLPAPVTPPPTPSATASSSPSDASSADPSETPEFTPDPSATPTARPSAAPADVAVNVREGELPTEWVVGQAVEVIVYVSNLGESSLSSVSVKVTIAKGQAAAKIQNVKPGETRRVRLKVAPKLEGPRTLKVEATLTKTYADYALANNVWTAEVEVAPPPEPTPAPSAAPTSTPTTAPPTPTPTPSVAPGDG